jgi:hypothetical protein
MKELKKLWLRLEKKGWSRNVRKARKKITSMVPRKQATQ